MEQNKREQFIIRRIGGTTYKAVSYTHLMRMNCKARVIPYRTKRYYVEGGFSHLIHMTAAHLW